MKQPKRYSLSATLILKIILLLLLFPQTLLSQNSLQVPDCLDESSATQKTEQAQYSEQTKPKTSTAEFDFTYAGTVSKLVPGAKASVWIPIASNTSEQTILRRIIKTPTNFVIQGDKKFGNQILYFEASANQEGNIPFSIGYRVRRISVHKNQGESKTSPQSALFLQGSKFVPVNQNLSSTVLNGIKIDSNQMTAARQIYDAVNQRMRYDKPIGQPWGRGDSVWACDHRFGNCTDFHSLFISLCREQQIAAKFEIGFPIRLDESNGSVSGYHCWAKFASNKTWTAVDISEANKAPDRSDYFFGNLPPDRITFSIGRDVTLSPPTTSPPINFFIYPHVEVDGKIHTSLEKEFAYHNLIMK